MNWAADKLVLAGLLAAALLMLLLLALVLSAARREGDATTDTAAGKLRRRYADSLRLSFRKAVKLIERNLAARAERYNLSWTLVLHDRAQAGLPLLEAGLPGALSADSSLAASAQGIGWHFFDKGVVVQLGADHLGAPDDPAGDGIWDAFLGLCRAYRPQRPFDAIVVALPCAALLQANAHSDSNSDSESESDSDRQMALAARARAIHRRLWLAQNRLALRFPIHLVISGCEQLPGFAAFGAALPDPQRRAMLGWASPYELVAPFRSSWVDSAMDEAVRTVADSCAELGALEVGAADSSAYLLLPGELERLRAGLKLFCDELMRPSAYHEAFLLRGIYLSGDASPEAILEAGLARDDVAAPPRAPMPAQMPAQMPVFLRDIFERKIFAETGLVRSSRQRLRHPAGRHLAWWAGLAAVVLWGGALAVATFQLDRSGDQLRAYLQALAPPPASAANDANNANNANDAAGGAASRRRAIAALEGFEPVGGARFYSVSMPGSWPLVDDLNERLQARLEQAFAGNAVAALSEAARARASLLTGVRRDPVSGALRENGQCSLPAGWEQQVAAAPPGGLNLKSLPEYDAMLAYITRLDELDRALGAMGRLAQSGAAPDGADLALAVRILLGKELRGTPTRTAALFRDAAQRTPPPSIMPIRQAARCSLKFASMALYRRLFDDNGLLRTERALVESARRLRQEGLVGLESAGLETHLAPWQRLRGALDAQAAQLSSGQGAWMQQRSLDLGSAQDTVLRRIGANGLLGPLAVQDTVDFAEQGFNRFQAAWQNTMPAPDGSDSVDASAGLAWSATGWVFTPERQALREALAGLLAQPTMKPAPPQPLPQVPPGATIRWDRAELDRAAGLAEARKAFRAGPYLALPPALQGAAATLVDQALAAHARSALAQAMMPAPRPASDSAAADPERAAVLRIQAWLGEIGAHALSAELADVLARDALARLAQLDEVFAAAQVYVPRDAGFGGWQGQKGAMLDAFGGGDAAGLDAYLAGQQEFIDTIVAQADAILAQLAGSALATQPPVARWQALAADLRRYRLKSPTSTRLALETFISTGSAEIDVGNCSEKLGARQSTRRGADLFAERLRALQAGMLARCRELANGNGRRQWQQFAEAYNRDLGRRAPFVMAGGAGAAAAFAGAVPADRDAVEAVMKLYDRARAAAALAARDPGQGGPRDEVRRADQQLRRLRALLAPLYPADDGQAGGLDVAVEFRVNTGAEAGAGNIIDWSLGVGPLTARPGETARALRWEPGMPVQLSLRLARDAAVAPKAEPGRPDLSVSGRTVTFRFDDPWALFSFVNAYRDADGAGDDGRGQLLRFDFPLAGSAAVPAAPDTRARVFVRLRVSAPGKHAALAWPALFPAQVPLWQDAQQKVEQQEVEQKEVAQREQEASP